MSDLDEKTEADRQDDGARTSTITVTRGEEASTGRRWQSRRNQLVVAIVLLVVVGSGAVFWQQNRGLPEDVAFEVAGSATKVEEVRDRAATLRALYGVQMPTDTDGRNQYWRDVVQSMVIGEVLAKAAAKRGTTVPQEKLDASLATYRDETFGTGEEGRSTYLAALASAGTSDAEVRAEVQRQLLIAALFADISADVEEPGAAEIERAFERWRCHFDQPEQRTISNIVTLTEDDALVAMKRLRAGQDFAAVARDRSADAASAAKGGDLGAVTAADLEPGYAEKAFGARQGAVFGPVETEHGWNVGLVRKVVPGSAAQLKNVSDQVAELDLSERKLDVWRSWLAAALKDTSVEYADQYRPSHPDKLPEGLDPASASESLEDCP